MSSPPPPPPSPWSPPPPPAPTPLPAPKISLPSGQLVPYTADELTQIDLKQIGVSGEGDHIDESLGPDGCGATRYYSCIWEQRYAAAITLVGAVSRWVDGDVVGISRLMPDIHPENISVASANLWACTKVRIKPYAFQGQLDPLPGASGIPLPRFQRAKIEATYELVPYDLAADGSDATPTFEFERYVIGPGFPGAEINTSSTYISMPSAGAAMYYSTSDNSRPGGGTPVPIPYGIGFTESVIAKKLTWKRLPFAMWGANRLLTQLVKGNGTTRGYIGCINQTTFFGHPPLTLRLDGVEERLLPDPCGQGYSWDITYMFSEKPYPFGWLGLYFFETNKAPLPVAKNGYYQSQSISQGGTTQSIAALIAAGDGAAIFPIREFANLLIPL